MERYNVHDEYMTPSEAGNVVLHADAQRALDAEREKVKELEKMYRFSVDERNKLNADMDNLELAMDDKDSQIAALTATSQPGGTHEL